MVSCFCHEWEGKSQLTLIGSGISDYLDPLIAPEFGSEMVDRLAVELKNWTDWDLCNWQDLSNVTPLKRLARSGFDVQVLKDAVCSAIVFPEKFDQYSQTLPHGIQRNLRRYREKVEAEGELRFSINSDADPTLLDTLIKLHAARWREHGEAGMITVNQSGQFLRDICDGFAQSGVLRIFSLLLRDKVAAIIVGFRWNNRLYGYLTGFDPQWAKLGVGRLLLFEALRHCCDNGCEAWDFLRGDEPYKAEWGAKQIERCRLIIQR